MKKFRVWLSEQDLQKKIIDFLKKNPNPDDEKVHDFAEKLGMEPDDLEAEFYKLATKHVKMHEQTFVQTLKRQGISKNKPDSDFDPTELKMGIEVEKEHVPNLEIAKEIAKDHLAEIPDYYTRLKKMEKQAENK